MKTTKNHEIIEADYVVPYRNAEVVINKLKLNDLNSSSVITTNLTVTSTLTAQVANLERLDVSNIANCHSLTIDSNITILGTTVTATNANMNLASMNVGTLYVNGYEVTGSSTSASSEGISKTNLLLGNNIISSDNITRDDVFQFQERITPLTAQGGYTQIAYDESKSIYLGLSDLGDYFLLSTDGVRWQEIATDLSDGISIHAVCWARTLDQFVCVGSNDNYVLVNVGFSPSYTTGDDVFLLTKTTGHISGISTTSWASVIYSYFENKVIAIAEDGSYYHTLNGSTWSVVLYSELKNTAYVWEQLRWIDRALTYCLMGTCSGSPYKVIASKHSSDTVWDILVTTYTQIDVLYIPTFSLFIAIAMDSGNTAYFLSSLNPHTEGWTIEKTITVATNIPKALEWMGNYSTAVCYSETAFYSTSNGHSWTQLTVLNECGGGAVGIYARRLNQLALVSANHVVSTIPIRLLSLGGKNVFDGPILCRDTILAKNVVGEMNPSKLFDLACERGCWTLNFSGAATTGSTKALYVKLGGIVTVTCPGFEFNCTQNGVLVLTPSSNPVPSTDTSGQNKSFCLIDNTTLSTLSVDTQGSFIFTPVIASGVFQANSRYTIQSWSCIYPYVNIN